MIPPDALLPDHKEVVRRLVPGPDRPFVTQNDRSCPFPKEAPRCPTI
jgi:hypothetical protein